MVSAALEISAEKVRDFGPRSRAVDTQTTDSLVLSFVRSEDGSDGITQFQATLSLTTCIIGAGIMALPQLPTRGGWVFCSGIMVVCCYAIGFSGVDGIGRTFTEYNKGRMEDEKLRDYVDLGRVATGRRGELVVSFLIVVNFIGCLAGYTILIAEQLEAMSGLFGFAISQQVWKVAIFLPFLAMSYLPNMTAMVKLVPIGILGSVLCCFMICIKALLDAHVWYGWKEEELAAVSQGQSLHQAWPQSLMALGSVTGTLFGAFGVNGNVPSILSEMREPEHFPSAMKTAMGLCLVLYMCIMLIGHYAWGSFVQDNLLVTMSRAPASPTEAFAFFEGGNSKWCYWTGPCGWIAPFIMQVCVLANIVISFPLSMMALINSLQSIDGIRQLVPVGSPANYAMRTTLVALVFAIALAVPNFGIVFAFFSSACGPILQTIFPVVCSVLIDRQITKRVHISLMQVALILLALLVVVVGATDSFNSLLASLESRPACESGAGMCAAGGTKFFPDFHELVVG